MKIKDVATKNVIAVHYFSTLFKCYRIFSENQISSIAVIKGKKPIGEIKREALLKILKKRNFSEIKESDLKKLKNLRVINFIEKCEKVDENEDVYIAIKKMIENNVQKIFVVDKKGNLVGVFSKSDIPRVRYKEFGEIFTTIDQMFEIIKEKKKISLKNLSKILNVPEDLVEDWSKILEERNLVEIDYPPIGSPVVKLKKG